MKRRQPHHRESDEEAIIRRREAIVDRALLYARLLSILDESRDEPEDSHVTAEQGSEEVGKEEEAEALPDSTSHFAIAVRMGSTCLASRLQ